MQKLISGWNTIGNISLFMFDREPFAVIYPEDMDTLDVDIAVSEAWGQNALTNAKSAEPVDSSDYRQILTREMKSANWEGFAMARISQAKRVAAFITRTVVAS